MVDISSADNVAPSFKPWTQIARNLSTHSRDGNDISVDVYAAFIQTVDSNVDCGERSTPLLDRESSDSTCRVGRTLTSARVDHVTPSRVPRFPTALLEGDFLSSHSCLHP